MKKRLFSRNAFWVWMLFLLVPIPLSNFSVFSPIAHAPLNTLFLNTSSSHPVLLAPRNNSLLTNYQPAFLWRELILPLGVSSYQIQVDNNGDFSSPEIDETTTETSFIPSTPLSPNTLYYWHVRALDGNGSFTGWSVRFQFKTAITSPLLISPAPGEALPNLRPMFDWDDVPNAASYLVQVSIYPDFRSNRRWRVNTSTLSLQKDLLANTTYYWRVRANPQTGAFGPSAWSEIRSFTTGTPPSIPVLLLPANNATVSATPFLDWKDSTTPPGATLAHYVLQIATDTQFNNLIYTSTTSDSQDNGAVLSEGTTYYWRVSAVSTEGHYSAWSKVRSFHTVMLTPTATSSPTATSTPYVTPTPSTPPSADVCAFNPTDGLVFATSMEHPYWYQLANRGNSGSVLAPYPPNRVYYSYPNNVSVVGNPVIKGTKVQQFQNLAGTHEPSNGFKYALPRSDIYYWRFYRQYEPGYQFTCESKAFSVYAHNPITFSLPAGERPDGTNEVSCFLQIMQNCWYDNRAHVERCFDPAGVYNRGEPVLYCYHLNQPTGYGEKFRQNVGEPHYITGGQWIDFQMMMKLNTPGQADGEIKLWIDGQLKMHYNTISFRTVPELQLNAASVGGYIGGTCTSARDQKIWDDHYMISKVFITDQVFGAMCETKTEWFDTGIPYLWDLSLQCWPGVNCP